MMVTLWPFNVSAMLALGPAIPAPTITTWYDGEVTDPIIGESLVKWERWLRALNNFAGL
jgi:hypothetical protein